MSSFHEALENSKNQVTQLEFQQKLYSFDFLTSFTAIGRSLTHIWITGIICLLATLGWYFCCFRFDAAISANSARRKLLLKKQRSENNNDSDEEEEDDNSDSSEAENKTSDQPTAKSKLHTKLYHHQEKKKNKNRRGNNSDKLSSSPTSLFLQKLITNLSSSSVTVFISSLIAIWPTWFAFSLFILRVFHESASTSEGTNIPKVSMIATIIPTLLLIFSEGFFGGCSIIYVIQENLSAGVLVHLLQLGISSYLLTSTFSEPLTLKDGKLVIHPHPYCAVLQFVALVGSLLIMIIFVVLFIQNEMRDSLKDDYPQIVEILDKTMPKWLFSSSSSSNKKSRGEIDKESMMMKRKK